MKTLIPTLGLSLILSILPTISQANVVDSHFRNIQDRVRACSTLPYTIQHQRRVYQQLISHCPEVRVLAPGQASVKIGSRTYQIRLIETEYSDGDLYDLVIREPRSNDRLRLYNVLAFGDVLLGVLGGRIDGLRQVYAPTRQ